MTDSEITTTILRQIRDEIIALRKDGEETRTEIRTLRVELKAELTALGEKVDALVRYAKNLTRRMEKALDELRERVGRLEKKVG